MTQIVTHTNEEEVGKPGGRQGLETGKNQVIFTDLAASAYGTGSVSFALISTTIPRIM
jgi:hypothetical protein